jgi:hypothetical protein
MYEDLEPIANLRFGEVVERLSREGQEKVSARIAALAARGQANSGPMVSARLNSALEMSERTCRALYEIWLDLILQRNEGKITREDVNFIMGKANPYTQTRITHISQVLASPEGSAPQWAVQQAQSKMQSVSSNIARELEIKLREQQAFARLEVPVDTRFIAFLHAFGENWLTRMSGPLTVPFAIAALVAPGLYKVLFATLAIVCGVLSSYEVWRNERKRSRRSS